MRRSPILTPEPGPSTLKRRRWGGHRLAALRGRVHDAQNPIGESWEFSTFPGSQSRCLGTLLVEQLGHPLPFLAKLIDTALPLSVQVHPDDNTSGPGKEEAWLILEAHPGAFVYAGIHEHVSRAEFEQATYDALDRPSAHGALLAKLRKIPVRRGMLILVPARTAHAIGGGILLAEIQQPSDCTYRLFDHGSGRPLHTDDALSTIVIDKQPEIWSPGDNPETLHGRHLEISPLGPGNHKLANVSYERLLVVMAGEVQIEHSEGHEILGAGDLRLATGPKFSLRIAPGSAAVIGAIPS